MLKNLILNSYQIEVFKYYMNISEYDIRYCLANRSNKVRNPKRLDKHPSLGFMAYKNRDGINVIHCKDFADSRYVGDCFKIAGRLLRLNSDIGTDFIKILDHIAIHVILKGNIPDNIITSLPAELLKTASKEYTINSIFSFSYLGISNNFYAYWSKLLYTDVKSTLNKNCVYDPLYVYVDNVLVHSSSRNIKNLAILYYLGIYKGGQIYKLYKPNETLRNKFKTNNKFLIEALHELQGNDILILTKSRKDCIVLRSILEYFKITTVDVISTCSESIILKDDFSLSYIVDKYSKIYSIFDYDNVGIPYMFYNYILYDIKPIVLESNREIDVDRCQFILEKIYYDSGINYDMEEMFTILSKYSYNVTIPNYFGKDISDMVSANKIYALGFIETILNNIIYEEGSAE